MFGAGKYAPQSFSGQRLLAHELAHVVQQGRRGLRNGPPPRFNYLRPADQSDFLPLAAGTGGGQRFVAHSLADLRSVRLSRAPSVRLQRAPKDEDTGDTGGDIEPRCGPEVTSALLAAASRVALHFHGLGDREKKESASALLDFTTGETAWDINELQWQGIGWIIDYQPDAGMGGDPLGGEDGQPRCEASVTVNGGCFLPNNVNYYIFGVMMRLVYDYLEGLEEEVPEESAPEPKEPVEEEIQAPPAAPTNNSGALIGPGGLTAEQYVDQYESRGMLDADVLGRDLLQVATGSPAYHAFIEQTVREEVWWISKDNVAYAFFQAANDAELTAINGYPSGHRLILYLWDQMTGYINVPTEVSERWRLWWLDLAKKTGGEGDTALDGAPDSSDTGNLEPPVEDTGGDIRCTFTGGPPEALSSRDAPKFSRDNMTCVIEFYKNLKYGGARKEQAVAWALAGYSGSPGASVPPEPDRAECVGSDVVHGDSFSLKWTPHLDE